ncbi:MAG TPA: hypothetical protein DHU55_13045 [Blastocatellia bacterium]|nr:hypothetical protein [Blastocatellia bacterium]HAF23419.1 hypothetical protein [Blastocatellia bacterium]HCX30673.1 hypothetical protein [Blastocatellia bacterium]
MPPRNANRRRLLLREYPGGMVNFHWFRKKRGDKVSGAKAQAQAQGNVSETTIFNGACPAVCT